MSARSSRRPDILHRRLGAQRLAGAPFAPFAPFASALEAIEALGAVQAQDWGGAKWALGQRLDGVTEAELDAELAHGTFLRTHILRPTWHLVSPADLRWMLALTSPRVHAANGSQYRNLGFGAAQLRASQAALQKALAGGHFLTRAEVTAVLSRAGLDVSTSLHAIALLMAAELDAVICSGPPRGKQQTYALLDERVPAAGRRLEGNAALAELARRYFTGHGPATAADFAWWSGLKVADASKALSLCDGALARVEEGGVEYWWCPAVDEEVARPRALLLPNYDEYVVAYADRAALVTEVDPSRLDARGNILFSNALVLDGRIAGTWRRSLSRRDVSVAVTLFRALSAGEEKQLAVAVKRYGTFLGLPARWAPATTVEVR